MRADHDFDPVPDRLTEGIGILPDQVEGVVMHWDDNTRLDEIDRAHCIGWAHRIIVADWEERDIDLTAQELHIHDQRGITSMIEPTRFRLPLPWRECEEETSGDKIGRAHV